MSYIPNSMIEKKIKPCLILLSKSAQKGKYATNFCLNTTRRLGRLLKAGLALPLLSSSADVITKERSGADRKAEGSKCQLHPHTSSEGEAEVEE